jgi:signal transduction histidine kinase
MLQDPVMQVVVVGALVNASGAIIAAYLWNQQRRDRYLLFWGMAWLVGTLRVLIHLPADVSPVLRTIEAGVLFPLLFIFTMLACYDMLPAKPWRSTTVVAVTSAVMFSYGLTSVAIGAPFQMAYALASAIFLLNGICTWMTWHSTRLSGYALAAVTFFCWSGWFALGLTLLGKDLPKSIVGPLFNFPLALSLVVIAFQRRSRELVESERTLQKIFDTAPTPIVIARTEGGGVERANALAVELLNGNAPGGRALTLDSTLEGLPHLRMELAAGRSVSGREFTVSRLGRTHTLGVNADRLDLDTGQRHIFTFYDLTELRDAEEQTRRLYVRLAGVEDGERRSLHRELHDTVGANLASLRIELDLIATFLARGESGSALRRLHNAGEVVTETAAMARDLMAGMRPPALDDLGLVAALRCYAQAQAQRLGTAIEVTGHDLAQRPGPLVENALFRIAHEAVVNAARHARPALVTIDASEDGDRIRLRIEDDGIGFDLQAQSTRSGHWGLQNMRERARAIGANFEIETALRAGTRVTVDAPREVS